MSGKIEMIIRKGIAKRKDLKYYPYWAWKIEGEDGNIVIITPSWEDLEKVILQSIIHEMQVDIVIGRNEFTRYREFLKNLYEKATNLQLKIHDYDIPDIILNCKKSKKEEEVVFWKK